METVSKDVVRETEEPPRCGSSHKGWSWQLRNSVSKIDDIVEIFSFTADEIKSLAEVVKEYPFKITPYYLSLIDKSDPGDPVRLQCVPSPEEVKLYFEAQNDPLGEEKDMVMPGLVHRYPDRVLITLTDICPVYCRHCTRKREWRKGRWIRTGGELEKIYEYISLHKEIRDVILSGGDPLILSTEKIESVLKGLRRIPHVEIIRIGTRCPVVLPQRVDKELVSVLRKYRPIWLNTHFNHPNEVTREAADACDMILCAGIPVNNQTVLLKGVNDDTATMTKLCQSLLRIGVRPYYLFQCDPVTGTAHFRTSIEKGLEIIKGMRGFTSGLCVPTYVVDGLDGQGKVPIQPDYIAAKEPAYFVLKGYKGEAFKYYNPED